MYMYIALSADACMEYIALVRSFICVIGGLQCYFIMKLNVVLLFTKLNWIKFCCFQFISVVTFLWLCSIPIVQLVAGPRVSTSTDEDLL